MDINSKAFSSERIWLCPVVEGPAPPADEPALNPHWRDVQANGDRARVSVSGKGGKTRGPASGAGLLSTLRAELTMAKRCNRVGVLRIVRLAAQRAGIELRVSPHWQDENRMSDRWEFPRAWTRMTSPSKVPRRDVSAHPERTSMTKGLPVEEGFGSSP